MSKQEFRGTPGEWQFDSYGHLMANGKEVHTRGFTTLAAGLPESMAEAEANSRLMGSAKDLLEALQRLLGSYRFIKPEFSGKSDAEKQAEAAIAKALGS